MSWSDLWVKPSGGTTWNYYHEKVIHLRSNEECIIHWISRAVKFNWTLILLSAILLFLRLGFFSPEKCILKDIHSFQGNSLWRVNAFLIILRHDLLCWFREHNTFQRQIVECYDKVRQLFLSLRFISVRFDNCSNCFVIWR